ncbi:MAG: hypothetical protein KDA75_05600 [Planctomycetaceae bacterium]|nr:hypothetical protein [Planctomycetaceae bacterium]
MSQYISHAQHRLLEYNVMKGALGLTLAAGLGIVGALSNWFYLQRLAKSEEKVYFIAIRDGVRLNVGDTIKSEHLEPVGIPKSSVDHLDSVAPQWSAKESVLNVRASRPLHEGEIIFDFDILQEAQQALAKTLQENEIVRWVPVDSGSVVPAHINPGDLVSFDVPRVGSGVPTPVGGTAGGARGNGMSEIIGPFRIVSLGGRREPENVATAQRRSSGAESVIAIVVTMKDGEMDSKAQRLFEAVRLAGNQGIQVLLHSAKLELQP